MQAAAPGQEKSELHFCKNGVFLPPPPFPLTLHGRRGATPCSPGRGHGGIPRHGGAPGSGEHGAGAPGTQGWLLRPPKGSPVPRQAEPRRRRLLPAQGVRGQRGSMLPGRTLSPGCLFKFGEVGPTPSKGAWGFGVNPCQASRQTPLRRGSVGAGARPGAEEPRSRRARNARGCALPRAQLAAPRGQGAPGVPQSPPQTKASHTPSRSPCVSPIN